MRVGLFVTCLADMMRPSIGFAALQLLQRAGCEVVVPQTQTCCGQPGWNAGDKPAARALAQKLIGEFADCEHVVLPSGSCAGMIKTHYAELLDDSPLWQSRAADLAARTHELSDFLVNVLNLAAVPGRYQGCVTYHDACSGLRELGIKTQPRQLLAMLPGLRLAEMADCETCCGFGGAFSVKFGDISAKMADSKCEHVQQMVQQQGASAVVLGDLGCMLNIEGRLRARGDTSTAVLHWAEVLAGQQGVVSESVSEAVSESTSGRASESEG